MRPKASAVPAPIPHMLAFACACDRVSGESLLTHTKSPAIARAAIIAPAAQQTTCVPRRGPLRNATALQA